MIDSTPSHATEAALYPECAPHASGMLALDGRHTMHWEECGNPDGVPLLFVHGGPGGGSLPHHRRFYDPSFWRIVLYDQRGAGRSTPIADLTDNTTQHLVDDIERLRAHLGIDRWLLFGGSWGSTLALVYAQTHPTRVLGLVLRGVFLASRGEVDWFIDGMRRFFPDAWREFADFVSAAERGDLLRAYYRRLTSPDPRINAPAALAWDRYETACSTLLPKAANAARPGGDAGALAIARIEAHYFMHDSFLVPNQILDNAARLQHVPCTIVQGRYDVICPPVSADALARAWPEAEFVVVPDAGHSVREPGTTRELVAAVRRMQAKVR
ncbi:MAG TPA: prolyl aminopeptidase [Casimicrobiaceae bacterium]|jgi:proline iminopeptidase|nr:prolyl aminopeptidase [Casimicrobiaceae bacterium]